MWLLKPSGYLNGVSGSSQTNFLWKSDDSLFFISDNHLTAGWCWLQDCNPKEEYNFYHIDAHNDLLAAPSSAVRIIEAQMDLNKYLSFRTNETSLTPDINWANYISLVASKFPQWFSKVCFATQEDIEPCQRDAIGRIPIYQHKIIEVPSQIETVILNEGLDKFELGEEGFWEDREPKSWILNLDLDYFFFRSVDEHPQLLTDAYIMKVGERIQEAREHIRIITVALSPECCRGWDKSFHVLDVLGAVIPEVGVFLKDVTVYRKVQ